MVELSAVSVTALAYVAVSALPVTLPVTFPVKFFTNGLARLIVMLPVEVTGVLPMVMLASEVVNPTLVTVPAPTEVTCALPDASNDNILFALVAAAGMINVAVSAVGSANLNTLSVNMLSMSCMPCVNLSNSLLMVEARNAPPCSKSVDLTLYVFLIRYTAADAAGADTNTTVPVPDEPELNVIV